MVKVEMKLYSHVITRVKLDRDDLPCSYDVWSMLNEVLVWDDPIDRLRRSLVHGIIMEMYRQD